MGEAKRRQAILGDRYGKPTTSESAKNTNKQLSEETIITSILQNHAAYRNRFKFIGDEIIEDVSTKAFTESWCISQLRQIPNVFDVVLKMLGDSYWSFFEEVVEPVVGDNIGIYRVPSQEALFSFNCKTETEALGRLGVLFLRGQINSLSECAFVYHRWDISCPKQKFNDEVDINKYVLPKTVLRQKEEFMKLLAVYNVKKKQLKLQKRLTSRGSWRLIAQKLQVDVWRLVRDCNSIERGTVLRSHRLMA